MPTKRDGVDSERLLPTQHRDEHSKFVGFSLGAESLSEACAGIPQWSSLGLHFHAGAQQQQRAHEAQFPILSVGFRRRNDGESAEPVWFIEIFAVPVEQKNAIRKRLMSEVMPKIVVPWLKDNFKIHQHLGTKELRLDYDATTQEVRQSVTQKLVPPRT
jgi:hypothetical protein